MNLNCSDGSFNTERADFLRYGEQEFENIDGNVRSVIKTLRDMPFNDSIIPRWSCQGHEEKDDYYIIFLAKNDGSELLYKMYRYLMNRFDKFYGGKHYTTFEVVHLMITRTIWEPHIKISITSSGIPELIQEIEQIWLELLEEIKNGNALE